MKKTGKEEGGKRRTTGKLIMKNIHQVLNRRRKVETSEHCDNFLSSSLGPRQPTILLTNSSPIFIQLLTHHISHTIQFKSRQLIHSIAEFWYLVVP